MYGYGSNKARLRTKWRVIRFAKSRKPAATPFRRNWQRYTT